MNVYKSVWSIIYTTIYIAYSHCLIFTYFFWHHSSDDDDRALRQAIQCVCRAIPMEHRLEVRGLWNSLTCLWTMSCGYSCVNFQVFPMHFRLYKYGLPLSWLYARRYWYVLDVSSTTLQTFNSWCNSTSKLNRTLEVFDVDGCREKTRNRANGSSCLTLSLSSSIRKHLSIWIWIIAFVPQLLLSHLDLDSTQSTVFGYIVQSTWCLSWLWLCWPNNIFRACPTQAMLAWRSKVGDWR